MNPVVIPRRLDAEEMTPRTRTTPTPIQPVDVPAPLQAWASVRPPSLASVSSSAYDYRNHSETPAAPQYWSARCIAPVRANHIYYVYGATAMSLSLPNGCAYIACLKTQV